ncbi:MAG: translation initiation factor IF-6 [Candidatus Methanomethylophilaceae archaeon]|nr:translation initiation factor IF-6 [Candidatus Methanomethylophilaceae archaeon]
MRLSRYSGNPNLGVYASVSESYAFIASDLGDDYVAEVEQTLGVRGIKTSVAGSFVVGSLMAMNSNGAIVSGLAEETEINRISEFLPVALLSDNMNAAGNNILVNDNGAIINPDMDDSSLREVGDALGVECVRASIAGIKTVGAICVATNKGVAVPPDTTDADIRLIQEVLKVEAVRTTLNHGCRTLSACVLANSKGAVVGDMTTPIEMGKLEDALVLY